MKQRKAPYGISRKEGGKRGNGGQRLKREGIAISQGKWKEAKSRKWKVGKGVKRGSECTPVLALVQKNAAGETKTKHGKWSNRE